MTFKKVFTKLFKSDDASATVETSSGKTAVGTKIKVVPVQLTHWQTEKAVAAEAIGQYTFLVPRNAAKGPIAHAFFALTGVKPVRVAMGWVFPRRSLKGAVRRRVKKAVVTTPKGATIKFPSALEQGTQEKVSAHS